MVAAVRPRPRRLPPSTRQGHAFLLLMAVSLVSLMMVGLLEWDASLVRPQASDVAQRSSASLGLQLMRQLAHAGAAAKFPRDAAAASSWLQESINSTSVWEAAQVERGRRDAQRSADARKCYILNGKSYRGHQHTTKSGMRCQPWALQHPNQHSFQPTHLPDAGLEGNFCRNPNGDVAPWCFNGEGTDPRYETCALPLCEQRYEEITVADTGTHPDTHRQAHVHSDPNSDTGAGSETETLPDATTDAKRVMTCPGTYTVDSAAARALTMYSSLTSRPNVNPDTTPLHWLSYYGSTSLAEWDHIVRAHSARLRLRRGETVFEAGCAAGAFVDSLARQYGVRVAGVDLAPNLVDIARRRVSRSAGRPEFCAASAANLSFVPDASYDHAVSFAVMMYISDTTVACTIAAELLRIVKPGGKIFIGQANDPEMGSLRPPNSPSQVLNEARGSEAHQCAAAARPLDRTIDMSSPE